MEKSKLKILLIGDNKADQLLLKHLLLDIGYDSKNIAMLKDIPNSPPTTYDLILCDLALNHTQGMNTIHKICNVFSSSTIITFIGYSDLEIASKAIELGVQDYLIKGEFKAHELQKSIDLSLKRSQLKETIKQTSNDYERLFQNSPIASLICEINDGRIVHANQSATDLYGYSNSHFLKIRFGDLNHNGQDIWINNLLGKEKVKCHHQTQNSQEVIVEVTATPVSFVNENFVLISIFDITDKEVAEEQIRMNNERFEFATIAASDLIYDWDLKTNQVYWGNSMYKFLGYADPEHFTISQWISKIHKDDRAEFTDNLDNIIKGIKLDTKWHKEYCIKSKDDTYLYVADKAIIIRENNQQAIRIIGALEDITERKNAEIQLHQSVKKFSFLFYNGSTIKFIIQYDELTIVDINDGVLDKTGHQRSELIGKPFTSFLRPEHALKFVENKDSFKSTLAQNIGIFEFQKKDGQLLSFEIQIISIEPEGKDICFLSCTDVTEKLTAEHSLKQSNERYKNVLKATKEAIYDWDLQAGTLSFGDNYQLLFGHKSGNELENFTSWNNNIHPDDREKVDISLNRLINSTENNRWENEYRFQKADHSYAYVIDKSFLLRDESGKAYRMVGAMEDITDRKLKEHELKLINSVVTSANDAVLIAEVEKKNTSGPHIIYANEAFYKMTGYTSDEVIGFTPRILQGPNSDRLELDRLRRALENWETCTIETINYKKSGEEFWVKFTVSPVADENGIYTHWISIQRDITSRKAKELENDFFKELNSELIEMEGFNEKMKLILSKISDRVNIKCAEAWISNLDQSALYRVVHIYDEQQCKSINTNIPHSLKLNDENIVDQRLYQSTYFWHGEELEKNPFNEFCKVENFKSIVSIPLKQHDQLIGLFIFYAHDNLKSRRSEFDFLKNLSDRLGPEVLRMKSEEELKTFFDLSPGVLCVTDQKGQIKKVNKGFIDLLGKSEKELVTHKIIDFVHPNDQEASIAFYKAIINEKGIKSFTNRNRKNKQDYLWLDWSAIYIPEQGYVYAAARDITNQMNLQNLFNEATSLARLGHWELNLKTGKVFWSPVTKEIHGVNENFEPNLDCAFEFYKEGQSRTVVKENILKAIAGEIDSLSLDSQIISVSGAEIWVKVIGEVERINGEAVRIFGSFQDINERKLIEEELKEINLRYALATNTTSLGIWDWDLVNNHLKWDDGMFVLYGITTEEFTNAFDAWTKALHEDDVAQAVEEVEKSCNESKTFNTRFRIRNPDGRIKYIKAYAHPITDDQGNAIRMVGINYDITEEVNQKLLLEQALNDKNNVLERINDGFFSVSLDWTVIYWNSAAEQIMGITKQNIVGKNLWEVFASDVPLRFYKEYHLALEKQSPRYFEEYYTSYKKWINVSVYPNHNGLSIFFKDTTEAKMHQEEVLEKSIRSMEKERNRIARELHDGVLQEMVGSMMLAESVFHSVTTSEAVNKKMSQLIYFLKKATEDIRRISHDLKSPEIENVSLISLIGKLVDQLNLLYDIDFIFQNDIIDKNLIIKEFHKTNLYRVVQELITNAIKHSGAQTIIIKIWNDNGFFQISVEDDGVGIDLEASGKVEGIGLRNIRDRIDAIRGLLEFKRNIDKGTKCIIKLKSNE